MDFVKIAPLLSEIRLFHVFGGRFWTWGLKKTDKKTTTEKKHLNFYALFASKGAHLGPEGANLLSKWEVFFWCFEGLEGFWRPWAPTSGP